MNTIFEIRRANLNSLIAEAGSAASLADRCDASASYLSQVKNGNRPRDGTQRNLGPKLARRLEAAMRKPTGWMGKEHVDNGVTEYGYLESHDGEIRDLGADYSRELYQRLAGRIVEAVCEEARAARSEGMRISDKRLMHETLPYLLGHYARKHM